MYSTMASAELLTIISFALYLQNIHGQSNTLLNNPIVGQNNVNQGFQSGTTVKNVKDTLFQNENMGKTIIFNSPNQANSMQPPIPQQSLGLPPLFSVQQQSLPQLINQQSPQIQQPELQPQFLYHSQTSNLPQETPQSSYQQPYNFMERQTTFIPVGIQQTAEPLNPYQYPNSGNIHFQQQIPTPSAQQVPLQVPHSIPLQNPFVPAYSAIPAMSYGGQRMELVTNLSGNYLVPIGSVPYSVPDGPLLTSIPNLPYTAVLSASNPTVGTNVVIPYQNQNFAVFDNPLDNLNEFNFDGEDSYLDFDNLTSLLVSLLQTPKKSSKYVQLNNQETTYAPFTPYKMNQGSKSSSLKALLPVIFNLIKERREGCRCEHDCDCKRKIKKDTEPQINEGYSKKRNYSMKEEMFRSIDSEEDAPRKPREHKNNRKKNKPIPKVSIESIENDDYDRLSEEDED